MHVRTLNAVDGATPVRFAASMKELNRCSWVGHDPRMQVYHDEEWGRPVRDDQRLFELLTLEGAQAGLSWSTVLYKRDAYRKAFRHFDPHTVARMRSSSVARWMNDPGLIRNRLKLESVLSNARAFLKVSDEFGTFSDYLWSFTGGKVIRNRPATHMEIPVSTPLSDRLSQDLRKRGFRFVGTTSCYAYLQAVGVVDDHLITCFRCVHR